ncbi:MAG: hypothetical protein HY722_02785 [Planctomycetes bacterium]|nr:hypothetical protein [Planctomycetota bacterium]
MTPLRSGAAALAILALTGPAGAQAFAPPARVAVVVEPAERLAACHQAMAYAAAALASELGAADRVFLLPADGESEAQGVWIPTATDDLAAAARAAMGVVTTGPGRTEPSSGLATALRVLGTDRAKSRGCIILVCPAGDDGPAGAEGSARTVRERLEAAPDVDHRLVLVGAGPPGQGARVRPTFAAAFEDRPYERGRYAGRGPWVVGVEDGAALVEALAAFAVALRAASGEESLEGPSSFEAGVLPEGAPSGRSFTLQTRVDSVEARVRWLLRLEVPEVVDPRAARPLGVEVEGLGGGRHEVRLRAAAALAGGRYLAGLGFQAGGERRRVTASLRGLGPALAISPDRLSFRRGPGDWVEGALLGDRELTVSNSGVEPLGPVSLEFQLHGDVPGGFRLLLDDGPLERSPDGVWRTPVEAATRGGAGPGETLGPGARLSHRLRVEVGRGAVRTVEGLWRVRLGGLVVAERPLELVPLGWDPVEWAAWVGGSALGLGFLALVVSQILIPTGALLWAVVRALASRATRGKATPAWKVAAPAGTAPAGPAEAGSAAAPKPEEQVVAWPGIDKEAALKDEDEAGEGGDDDEKEEEEEEEEEEKEED